MAGGLLAVVLILYLQAFGLPLRESLFTSPGPTRIESATVVRVLRGFRGKFGGRYTHQVRLDSGREGEIETSDLFSPGARVRLTYSQGAGRRLNVVGYQACQGECR
jgi:hypothetical protein